MAHQRAGHAAEARQWLDKAIRQMEQDIQAADLMWNRRLTLQLLRREAESLVRGGAIGQPTSRGE
jgi:hypothetical protein